MERFQGVATKYLDNYFYWFRWDQILISACQKSNYRAVQMLRSAYKGPRYEVKLSLSNRTTDEKLIYCGIQYRGYIKR